ncbi:MAG: PTS mannose transporter subunit IIC [Proteobacteria bacterium SG_bin7]|nr:MAG: PTS mannose transporter subunit IIC [Proteobacteria bacterium SG_bin7]
MILSLMSPLSGVLHRIETIPDPVFAGKTLGNGISIDPTSTTLLSPFAGKVIQLHRCCHALTIKHENGLEVLIHIGIDTVSMNGKGFTTFVKVGDLVKSGQRLIEFDADFIAQNATSLLTQMIVLNGELVVEYLPRSGNVIAGKDNALELKLKLTQSDKIKSKNGQKLNSEKIKIINPNGLHARPVAVMSAAAKNFLSDINLVRDGKSANAKSVVAVMSLDVRFNDEVYFEATGDDANFAIQKLSKILREGLGESAHEEEKSTKVATTSREDNQNLIYGVTASPGIAVGQVFQIRHQDISVIEEARDVHAERRKLDEALDQAKVQLGALQSSMTDTSKAAIFAAHEEILSDPDILLSVDFIIGEKKTAAYAWKTAINSFAKNLASLKNELLAARANDVRDVGTRVLKLLVGELAKTKIVLPYNAILIAEDLTPSDVAEIDVSRVKGFCTVAGGSTSHVAILARSFGIPALAAIDPKVLEISNGSTVIIEARKGVLRLNPSANDIAQVENEQLQNEKKRKEDLAKSSHEAKTIDGVTIEVAANIGTSTESERAMSLGADGVGLLRSEFLFLERSEAPTEDEQYEIYKKIAKSVGDSPLIIRTLDIGGDKPLPYLPIPKEENPFLGERGIRVGLNRPEILRAQLRAILRASIAGKVMVMFPMIANTKELTQAKAILTEETKKLNVKPIPVGIMVEVPSTAILADKFAPLVDFFSVGTNDLTQYTLAMDRGNPKMAKYIDGVDPAVLRLIDMTVKAAKKHEKWVGVCGGIASESIAVPLLIGLGVTELSVSVPSVPTIKSQVRNLKLKECEDLAKSALMCESASQVRDLVRSRYVF